MPENYSGTISLSKASPALAYYPTRLEKSRNKQIDIIVHMGLKDIGASLPPGFRFNPSDEELICHYLYKKIVNEEVLKGTLMEVDLHTCEPWQLPEMAKLNASEWYFFSFRDRKYATGYRTNRATTSGYWKATGKDRIVQDPVTSEVVGMRKTLVFYLNRAPDGTKTGWIMHEFRLETPHTAPKEDWVLCRVFSKSKQGDDTIINHITPPQNTYQSNLKHVIDPSSSPPPLQNPTTSQTHHNNNNAFHKHNIHPPCHQNQPHITMMSLNPNSFFHHFSLELNHLPATPSVATLAHSDDNEDVDDDDDCFKFLWEWREDDDNNNNGMDIVSTLEDQLLFKVDDNSMLL